MKNLIYIPNLCYKIIIKLLKKKNLYVKKMMPMYFGYFEIDIIENFLNFLCGFSKILIDYFIKLCIHTH